MSSQQDALMYPTNPIPSEILDEIRSGYNEETKTIRFFLTEGLFADVDLFARTRLRVYYN